MSADQFVDAVYKIKFEKAHAENIKLRAEVEVLREVEAGVRELPMVNRRTLDALAHLDALRKEKP